MTTAFLRGRDHLQIGAITTRAAARCAAALSIGGAPKAYAHTDPNEDGVVFIAGAGGQLVAVADGHGGVAASEAVLEHLVAVAQARWLDPQSPLRGRWQEEALALLAGANARVLAQRARDAGRTRSRTTLALVVARPDEGRCYVASIGDSHVFQAQPAGAFDLACELSRSGECFFLGVGDETSETLLEKCVIGSEPIDETRALVVVTDGLSERGVGVDDPDATVADAVRRAAESEPGARAIETARLVVEAALAAHARQPSGDNVATGVIWLAE